MNEQSKAAKRRFSDGAFHTRYFVGKGVDIGGKPDPLGQYIPVFSRMESVKVWDLEDGDAQKMAGVADNSFDFVHSSHCLEHMHDVAEALLNWVRIVKPGGFLIVTVPDEDLYENGHWPSRYNSDHKWSFTIHKNKSKLPRSINVMDLLSDISHLAEVERILLVRDFFQDAYAGKIDQTITPGAECAIEFVLRKREHIVALEIETDSKQNPNTSVTSTPAYTTTENHPNVTQDCSPPADDLYQQAANLVDANKIDEAIQVLEKLVITNTDNALAHNDLGVLYQRIGKPEKSRHHHEIASQLQPAHEVFQKNLADLLYREFGALEEALTIYVRLYGQNCYDVETIRAIAHICLEVDKPEDARFFLEQILAITPWDQDAADTLSSLPMEA